MFVYCFLIVFRRDADFVEPCMAIDEQGQGALADILIPTTCPCHGCNEPVVRAGKQNTRSPQSRILESVPTITNICNASPCACRQGVRR